MASPVPDSYSCASGGSIYGGRSGWPAWLSGVPLNTWTAIAGTSGAGGSAINAYSSFAVKPSNSEIIIAAAGGHSDSSDNGVYSLVLSADAPSWTTRRTSSTPTADVLYYADGRPTSRHIYNHVFYIPSIDSVLLAGCHFGYGGGTPTGGGFDLFSLATNDWLARYTYADSPNSTYGAVFDGANVWTPNRKFDTTTNTWTTHSASMGRFPQAYDSSRGQIFSLQFGDGQGFNPELLCVASKTNSGGTSSSITFNASSAYTAWLAAAPQYAALDYDPLLDKFLFYHGGETGVVYVITPNAGTAWDMAVLSTSGAPSVASGAGIHKRFQYVSALKGFVLLPQASSSLYFLRTA